MGRPKHQRPELEAVLRAAEQQGWRVVKGRYFKMYCPCVDKHIKTVKLTPSGANYRQNLIGQLLRSTCWREDG